MVDIPCEIALIWLLEWSGHQLDEPTGFFGGLEQQLKYYDLIS